MIIFFCNESDSFLKIFLAKVFKISKCVVAVVEKSDVVPATALQLSAPVTSVASLYRQASPGAVINLSQRSDSSSLTGTVPSPLVNVFSVANSSAAGDSGGLVGRPATHATVLHTIRPVTTQAIMVCIMLYCIMLYYVDIDVHYFSK